MGLPVTAPSSAPSSTLPSMSTLDNGGSKSRKKLSQRLYRSTEAEDFEQLRQIIQELTKENPLTRHDVLIKGLYVQKLGIDEYTDFSVAIGIIRHLDREYRALLAEHVAALTSTYPSGSSMQHFAFHPAVSQFPADSWSVNHGVQTTPMHPHMPSPGSSNIAYSTYDRQNMDAVHNYYISPTNY
ncbi:uncharacterized protein EDB93DRAFT_1145970 [Suillus bovinus]|uniref:uncharacterized protein n=1 Tax=Suillus bovinus TaxID=48563 RepID=UPI001B86FD2D|nr:uncharacterized protein EDB93DRAFT_1145970 [Suillus bovinus]KAG2147881.1 hypothetical protein EDB93DRAFT_1145970 [Suillus bovinus]